MSLKSINPASGRLIQVYPQTKPASLEKMLDCSNSVFLSWRRISFAKRSSKLSSAARLLRKNTDSYAHIMALEMGKPLSQGRSEIEKCAWICDYFSRNASWMLAPDLVKTDASKSYVAYEPLGVILGIMPWNFPFFQVFRFCVSALMAGNTVVIKHASNVSGCALAIEELFRDAGFPKGVFQVVLIGSNRARSLIEHPVIRGVAFTGSTEAGRKVAECAGRALKKTVLELGGSDPYLILGDADIEHAAKVCVSSRMMNSGQSCVSSKRWVVASKLKEKFEGMVLNLMKEYRMGDPLEGTTMLGPLARFDLRDGLHTQVRRSIAKGARLLLGGVIPKMQGSFYPATLLSDVSAGMPAYHEEIFGPVGCIIPVKDERSAVKVANDSKFGLGCSVFTNDIPKAEQMALNELEAGSCFVNTFVRSHPALPFGGIKDSGYGRELSVFGIREFVNIKTVYVD